MRSTATGFAPSTTGGTSVLTCAAAAAATARITMRVLICSSPLLLRLQVPSSAEEGFEILVRLVAVADAALTGVRHKGNPVGRLNVHSKSGIDPPLHISGPVRRHVRVL